MYIYVCGKHIILSMKVYPVELVHGRLNGRAGNQYIISQRFVDVCEHTYCILLPFQETCKVFHNRCTSKITTIHIAWSTLLYHDVSSYTLHLPYMHLCKMLYPPFSHPPPPPLFLSAWKTLVCWPASNASYPSTSYFSTPC